jgi:hypothetical protein
MSVVWATAFAAIYYYFARYRAGAVVVWIGVVSHWVLDWITHGPDMQLYPGGARFGLALWNSHRPVGFRCLRRFIAGVLHRRPLWGGAAGRHVGYCVAGDHSDDHYASVGLVVRSPPGFARIRAWLRVLNS